MSDGSPYGSVRMVSTRAAAYSSYRLRGTSSRVGALHACPLMKAMIGPSEAIATAVILEEQSVIDVLRGRRVVETSVVHYVIDVADEGDYAELER